MVRLKIDMFCEKTVVKMWIGPSHKVSALIAFCNKTLSEVEAFGGSCEIKGMTSTWALADGGLVFCEDDSIFELDGWEEADKACVYHMCYFSKISMYFLPSTFRWI